MLILKQNVYLDHILEHFFFKFPSIRNFYYTHYVLKYALNVAFCILYGRIIFLSLCVTILECLCLQCAVHFFTCVYKNEFILNVI